MMTWRRSLPSHERSMKHDLLCVRIELSEMSPLSWPIHSIGEVSLSDESLELGFDFRFVTLTSPLQDTISSFVEYPHSWHSTPPSAKFLFLFFDKLQSV